MKYREEISDIISRRRSDALEAAFRLFSQRTIEEVNMGDIAREAELGVATLYRYFGTKFQLCVELAALKWREYAAEVEARYALLHGAQMTAYEEFSFYLDSYIALYDGHKEMLRFIANFDLFARHEQATPEDLAGYYASVNFFTEKFHRLYQRACSDHTMRTDLTEREMYFGVMYTMLTTAQKLACGIIYPMEDDGLHPRRLLEEQKQMFLRYVRA